MKHLHAIIIAGLTVACVIVFGFVVKSVGDLNGLFDTKIITLSAPGTATSTSAGRIPPPLIFSIHPTVKHGLATVTAASPKVFAYAHGTVSADGKLFIGMADKSENPFPSNEIVVFSDQDINHPTLLTMPALWDV